FHVTGVQTCALPISYYEREAHEDVRQYLISTLSDYLGPFRVTEFNYTVDQVKAELASNYPTFNQDEVLYPVENVLGVLPGTNPRSEERRVGKEWRSR